MGRGKDQYPQYPVGADLVVYRPQTDSEWETWRDNRETARMNIRRRFCQQHEPCRDHAGQEINTIFDMLGLSNDRWGVETRG